MADPEADTYEDSIESGRADAVTLKPYLFLVFECDRPAAGGARFGLANIDEVAIGRGPERRQDRQVTGGVSRLFVRVPGRSMSSRHARLLRTQGGWVLEDAGSTNGSFINGHRVERVLLRDGDTLEVGHSLFLLREAVPTPSGTEPDLDSSSFQDDPPGFSTLLPAPRAALAALAQIALSTIPVLLLGETGTGKEVVAHSLHQLSRRSGPFVALNCGSLPPNLVESHLFGHVRGSFSGAVRDELGAIRAAEGGTLLLDEIGDLPRAAQPALLRFLQQGEVRPVGSSRVHRVDARIVAATHRPLADMTSLGDFRQDLFERLKGFTYCLPCLRDRREDLGLIIARILAQNGLIESSAPFSTNAGLGLVSGDWPGNIRELELALRRAYALAGPGMIRESHLQPSSDGSPSRSSVPRSKEAGTAKPLTEDEEKLRKELLVQLERHQGSIPKVAQAFGKARMQIHRWLKKFEIDATSFRQR
jgi:DNA-binding NtrC family response regulator